MFKGENLANYIFKDWNPFRNKFQRWCIKHKLIHKLDYEYLYRDSDDELIGAIVLYEGNKFLLWFLQMVTNYYIGNTTMVKVRDGKIVW